MLRNYFVQLNARVLQCRGQHFFTARYDEHLTDRVLFVWLHEDRWAHEPEFAVDVCALSGTLAAPCVR